MKKVNLQLHTTLCRGLKAALIATALFVGCGVATAQAPSDSTSAAAQPQLSAEDMFNKGYAFMENKEYEQAAEWYR